MKSILILVLIAGSFGLSAVAQMPPPPPPAPLIYKAPEKNDLKEFVVEDKSFQITFPGVPKIGKQEIPNGNVTTYEVYRQGSNSVVSVIEYNFDLSDQSEKVFETIKKNLLNSGKLSIEAEKEIKIDGNPAKEFDVLEGYVFQKVGYLIDEKRIYEIKSDVTNWQILNEYHKDKVADFQSESERFLASFKLDKAGAIAAEKTPEDFAGSAAATNYTNKFFNFSIDYPAGWYQLENADVKTNLASGAEYYKTLNEKADKMFQQSLRKETIILAVSQRKEGVDKGTNLSVGVIKQPNEQAKAEEVSAVTEKNALMNPNTKIITPTEKTVLNGIPFAAASFQIEFKGLTVYQKVYTMMSRGYSVTFAFTYRNPEGQKALENIINSLKPVKK